jgi:predicted kinase
MAMTQNEQPVLYIFSRLPGVGKSTLSQRLAARLRCAYLRIDTVEQSLRDLCSLAVEGEGYRLSYRLAADNLKIGVSVVADSCNPIELTRREWEEVALNSKATPINIEVACRDKTEHRNRVETRRSDIPGHRLPNWEDVEQRLYHKWSKERILIDTSGKTIEESFDELCSALRGRHQTLDGGKPEGGNPSWRWSSRGRKAHG